MTYLYRDHSVERERNNSRTNQNISRSDPLAIIYNEGLWRIFKVSPLYNLYYSEVHLKNYAAKIKQALVSAVTVSSMKYSVTCEQLAGLKYSEDDPSGLMITVSSTQDNSIESKPCYSAILLSWGVRENISKNVTHLPFMLERGEQKVGVSVRASLQGIFDCNIKQFYFTQFQLLQFGFSFVECDSSRSTDAFNLVYRTPQVDKERLTMTFNVGDIHTIWNSVKEDDDRLSQQVKMAYQLLQNHIFDTIMFDITICDLCEIKTPKAEVKMNGVVKMKTPEMVNSVFTLLNDFNCIYEKNNTMVED